MASTADKVSRQAHAQHDVHFWPPNVQQQQQLQVLQQTWDGADGAVGQLEGAQEQQRRGVARVLPAPAVGHQQQQSEKIESGNVVENSEKGSEMTTSLYLQHYHPQLAQQLQNVYNQGAFLSAAGGMPSQFPGFVIAPFPNGAAAGLAFGTPAPSSVGGAKTSPPGSGKKRPRAKSGSPSPSKKRASDSADGKISSPYRGVSWHKRDKKWIARAWVNSKTVNIGSYSNETFAALMVDLKTIESTPGPSHTMTNLNFSDAEERKKLVEEFLQDEKLGQKLGQMLAQSALKTVTQDPAPPVMTGTANVNSMSSFAHLSHQPFVASVDPSVVPFQQSEPTSKTSNE